MVELVWGEWPGLGSSRGKPVGPVKLISVSVPVMETSQLNVASIFARSGKHNTLYLYLGEETVVRC